MSVIRKKLKAKTSYSQVKVKRFPIDVLQPAPYNARTITEAALQGLSHSLERFGVLALPVVNLRADGPRLIGGHQRVAALKRAKATEVDCIVVTFDDEQERRANFALNNAAIEGSFIPDLTRELIDRIELAVGAESGKLVEQLRFDLLLRQVMRDVAATQGVDDVVTEGKTFDDDEVPLGKTVSDSQPLIPYRLGEHCLIAGGLSEPGTLTEFGLGERADMTFTRFAAKQAYNESFLDVYLRHVLQNTDGGIYLATRADRLSQVQMAFERLGGHWSNTIVCYDPAAKGRQVEAYRDVALLLLYGWRDGGMRLFFGDRTQGNTYRLRQSPPKDGLPVDVVVRHVLNSSKKNGLVFDPFAGDGGTLIAAQKTGRRLCGYVSNCRELDRVRRRWTRFVHGPDANWKVLTSPV